MGKPGKRITQLRTSIDTAKKYEIEEAVKLVKQSAVAKFDETIDLAIVLGVNPKYADQMVRGALMLPEGTGKKVRVIVFAKGDKEKEALDAGAEAAGGDELVEKVLAGWVDFDKTIATPDMMAKVGRLGKVLGPRGMMPNPKLGTVTVDIKKAVSELKGGRIEFKVDKAGIIHVPIGKASFGHDKIKNNFSALFEAIMKAKPQTSKGTYVKSITLSSTMGLGIKLNPQTLLAQYAGV